MLYAIVSYFKFLVKATNQHGVHSPFVYALVTKCFYDKKKHPAYTILHDYRKVLLQSKESILVQDFGAGSRVFKTNTRKVKDIAKHAGISLKRQQLLYRLCTWFKFNSSLELGTSLGLSTIALAIQKNNTLISVEGCENTAEVARKQLRDFGHPEVEIVVSDFKKVLESLPKTKFDFIYVDGNHNKESTLLYFDLLLKFVHNDTVLIFDDIYWSKGMTEAWKAIISHPKVTVSMDTFYWGIVFFRKEQKKESFTIRL